MKLISRTGLAVLLATSALAANTAFAQETQPQKLEQNSTSSAKPLAPGQTNVEGQSAAERAPGQQQKAGDATAKDAAPGQMQKTGEADAATDVAPGQLKKDQAAGEQPPSDETTASIDISAEQKTEIRTLIRETQVEPVQVDIDLRVGVAVPTTVEFHPLPPRFVEIVPQYRGYEYFLLADGRIIIVKPATHEVVYILVV